jgi:hypothetical protein
MISPLFFKHRGSTHYLVSLFRFDTIAVTSSERRLHAAIPTSDPFGPFLSLLLLPLPSFNKPPLQVDNATGAVAPSISLHGTAQYSPRGIRRAS